MTPPIFWRHMVPTSFTNNIPRIRHLLGEQIGNVRIIASSGTNSDLSTPLLPSSEGSASPQLPSYVSAGYVLWGMTWTILHGLMHWSGLGCRSIKEGNASVIFTSFLIMQLVREHRMRSIWGLFSDLAYWLNHLFEKQQVLCVKDIVSHLGTRLVAGLDCLCVVDTLFWTCICPLWWITKI